MFSPAPHLGVKGTNARLFGQSVGWRCTLSGWRVQWKGHDSPDPLSSSKRIVLYPEKQPDYIHWLLVVEVAAHSCENYLARPTAIYRRCASLNSP